MSVQAEPDVVVSPSGDGALWPALWAMELLADRAPRRAAPDLEVTETDHLTLVRARVAEAAAMNPARFQEATTEAYAAIRGQLAARRVGCPVRFWNFIPFIGLRCEDQRDRYMVFNAGRHAAYVAWFDNGGGNGWRIPTASAVGHEGNDLLIYALAAETAGRAVENPRQIPAYHYSPRYGPLPPCFARATIARFHPGGPERVLVGGTASVVGEDSRHIGDLDRQIRETFGNLASLARAAAGGGGGDGADARAWLARFRELLVYHVRDEDRDRVLDMIRASFPSLRRVQFVRATVCRPELLVEIEGLADVEPEAAL